MSEGVGETVRERRKRDEKTSWMNEFGEIPAKQEEGRKKENGKRGNAVGSHGKGCNSVDN